MMMKTFNLHCWICYLCISLLTLTLQSFSSNKTCCSCEAFSPPPPPLLPSSLLLLSNTSRGGVHPIHDHTTISSLSSSSSKIAPPISSRRNNNKSHLYASSFNNNNENDSSSTTNTSKKNKNKNNILKPFVNNPIKSILFSLAMTSSGAILGPFLDTYHSSFHVLQYDQPYTNQLWSSNLDHPALITTYWVPPLFGLAGFIIGWLYILLEYQFPTTVATTTTTTTTEDEEEEQQQVVKMPTPTVSEILIGISMFTFQYWLSGILYAYNVDRNIILIIMTLYASIGYYYLNPTKISGLLTSLATAIGGPLIEVGLISTLAGTDGGGYHYTDGIQFYGYFPLWIIPVYFLGGPANGNLAFGYWNGLDRLLGLKEQEKKEKEEQKKEVYNDPCEYCNDTRTVSCPNCDGMGYYITYGTSVTCNCCKGSGLVICRNCFDRYDDLDPNDIESIREFMADVTSRS